MHFYCRKMEKRNTLKEREQKIPGIPRPSYYSSKRCSMCSPSAGSCFPRHCVKLCCLAVQDRSSLSLSLQPQGGFNAKTWQIQSGWTLAERLHSATCDHPGDWLLLEEGRRFEPAKC